MARRSWPSQAAFYAEGDGMGEARDKSGERDYGVWWREWEHGPRWRVSHVLDTDEVIAVAMSGEMADQVVLLAEGCVESEVEEALEGWTERCYHVEGLVWARRQLEAWSPI